MVTTDKKSKAAPPATKWVSFLRQYGPLPQNGNSYDEDIQRTSRRTKLAPIRLPTPSLARIMEALRADPPRSVIITGTAGDGKTYHCREIWSELGGTEEAWDDIEKIKYLQLGERRLAVIRDFSELHRPEHPEERETVLREMAEHLLAPNPTRVYLVAANDGQLLEQWKAVESSPSIDSVRLAVEDLLVEGKTKRVEVRLELINLSAQSANRMLPQVIDEVLKHKGWDLCAGCELRQPAEGPGCPIWENRRRLLGEGTERLLRDRLSQLMELSDRNGTHFPVRQLFLLVSNILLGHPDAEHGLLACTGVASVLAAGTADKASIYRNVFGDNLTSRRRHTTPIFESLSRFGIGNETSNQIDAVLVYGSDDPELSAQFKTLVLSDPLYGGSARFLGLQHDYLEGGEDAERGSFLKALRGQRQRLFFTVPNAVAAELGLWRLTVFRYSGDYLEIINQFGRGGPINRSVVSPLVRGMNRVFTGILLSNQDQLFLASSGSHSSAKISRVLEEQIQVAPKLGEEVTLKWEGQEVFLVTSIGNVPNVGPARLRLTLLRFEFLRRVADGALPSSFSLECYEDLLAYKATILKALEARKRHDHTSEANPDELILQFIRIDKDGRANPESVEVTLR